MVRSSSAVLEGVDGQILPGNQVCSRGRRLAVALVHLNQWT